MGIRHAATASRFADHSNPLAPAFSATTCPSAVAARTRRPVASDVYAYFPTTSGGGTWGGRSTRWSCVLVNRADASGASARRSRIVPSPLGPFAGERRVLRASPCDWPHSLAGGPRKRPRASRTSSAPGWAATASKRTRVASSARPRRSSSVASRMREAAEPSAATSRSSFLRTSSLTESARRQPVEERRHRVVVEPEERADRALERGVLVAALLAPADEAEELGRRVPREGELGERADLHLREGSLPRVREARAMSEREEAAS